MQQNSFFSPVLTDQGIDDIERHAIADFRQREKLGHRGSQALGIFETKDVINTSHCQSVKSARNPGIIMVEQGSDIDDFRYFPRKQFTHVRFTPHALTLLAKFEIAVNQSP